MVVLAWVPVADNITAGGGGHPLERPPSSLRSRTPCFSGGDPVVGLFGG
jgi:hypothetical protein